MNLKLDEMLRASRRLTETVIPEPMTNEELQRVQQQFDTGSLVDDDIEHVDREIHSRRKAAKPSPKQPA